MDTSSTGNLDLIVIGGGPAGSHIAEGCASAGMSVALVEGDQLGGTCLNYGCDPMNKMIRTGEVLRVARSADRFGIEMSGVRLDWPALRENIAAMIHEIRDGDGVQDMRGKGIEVVQGRGQFVSPHGIEVDDRRLSADRFVIATGSQTGIPGIDGLADTGYLTNTDMFTLSHLPRSLVILGENTHAMEFAQVYLNFGIEVTLVTPEPGILPREDADVAEELAAVLRRDGLVVHMETEVVSARASSGGRKCLVLRSNDGEVKLEAEEILIATDRKPRVDGLGLDRAGVDWSPDGIRVDATMRTTAPHIWAAGDVTGILSYTHVANYQAGIALDHILHPGSQLEADYRVVPRKVFTQPELARVGLTEAEARSDGYDVVTSTMAYKDLPRALTLAERDGLVKLVVDRATREVLGGHVLGARASEVIAQVALVMQHRLPVSAISEALHTHPTMSEAVYWAAKNLVDEAGDGDRLSARDVSA